MPVLASTATTGFDDSNHHEPGAGSFDASSVHFT